MSTIRFLDLETESHTHLGRKGSPYTDKNWIVMPGWRDDVNGVPGTVVDHYFRSRAEAEDPDNPWFNLDGVDILVCFNAMFEMSWFLTRHREEFLKFLRRGGRVLCTQLAEYLLSHQTWTYPALDEVAPKHGGTHKVDGIKALWDQGVLTSEMDPALLREYLSGPNGDVNNTALVFYSQMLKLQAKGMWRMYLERCEGMLAFSCCEVSGLKVDLDIAHANHKVQLEELAGIRAELEKLVPTDLPDTLTFNWGSDYHMSALLFGGEVRYRKRVPYDPPKMEKGDFLRFGEVKRGTPVEETTKRVPVETLSTDGALDYTLIAAFAVDGPLVTMASGKQKGQPKVFREDTDVPAMKWDDDGRYRFPGIIKFADMPEVLRDKYTGKRAEFQQARALPDGSPVYSTSGDSLKALQTFGFEQAKLLMRAAELEKDNGAFYIAHEYDRDGNVKKSKGMLQYVDSDGMIHHNLNQCATGTTRLSSSNPNLQQLPKVDEDDPLAGSRVKEMFVSRFGADGSIGEVDYTALEVVWCAALSGDKNLLEKLQAGTDMHLYRLAGKHDNWNGFNYDQLVQIKKGKLAPEWQGRMMKARSDIKPKAFSAQYGASAMGIAFNTGCTVEEAQEFLDNEAALFPESIAFRQVVRDAVELTGSSMEGLCREQSEHGWTVYRRGYYQAPGGTCYSFRQYPKWDRDSRQTVMDYKDTQIANYWNQGEAGFMMTLTAGRVIRWMLARPGFMVTEFLINNVHDALYTDCHNDTQREVNLGIKAIMEDAPRYMSAELGYNIGHIPFPAAAESGSSMFNKTHLH